MSSFILFRMFEKAHSNIGLRCPLRRTPFQLKSREQLANLTTDTFLFNALNFHNSLKNSVSEFDNQRLFCLDEENEATLYCLDCEEHFCEICTKAHQKSKLSKNHQLISIEEMKNQTQINVISKSNSNTFLYCQKHQNEEVKLFCEDCKELIGSLCISKHPSHKVLVLSDIIRNEKQSLIDLINQVRFFFVSELT